MIDSYEKLLLINLSTVESAKKRRFITSTQIFEHTSLGDAENQTQQQNIFHCVC